MKKYMFGFFVLILSVEAFAVGQWTNGNQVIRSIIWRPDYHGFYVEADTFDNVGDCTGTGESLYVFDPVVEQDTKNMDRIFSLVNTAMIAGLRVHVFVDGCDRGYPKVTGVQINR